MKYTAATALLPLLLSACAMTEVGGVMHPTVSGSLTVRSPDGNEVRWTPDQCVSGDLAYFAGFDFLSTHDEGHLRAALDPIDGPVVRWTSVASGVQQSVVLHHADCTRLDVEARLTDWRVNDVREFAGYVDLQCASSDGARFEGHLAVDHCH